MSLAGKHILQCPKCGHQQETMIWKSVNVTHEPELKNKLFAAEINALDCSQCKNRTFVNTPLMYNDMRLKFCVQFYPADFVNDPNLMRQFRKDGTLDFDDMQELTAHSCEYLAKPHVVFSMNEMVRYIYFRDKIISAHES